MSLCCVKLFPTALKRVSPFNLTTKKKKSLEFLKDSSDILSMSNGPTCAHHCSKIFSLSLLPGNHPLFYVTFYSSGTLQREKLSFINRNATKILCVRHPTLSRIIVIGDEAPRILMRYVPELSREHLICLARF